MPDSFSQRHRLAGPPPGTLLRDDVPPSFRMFLLDMVHEKHFDYHELRKVISYVLQVWPGNGYARLPYDDCRHHIQTCAWFHIYDIVEGLYKFLDEKHRMSYSGATSLFVKQINKALVDQNLGWQLVSGKLLMRGDEAFEATMKTAVAVLAQDRKTTAAGHLRFVITALSDRPQPNTSGAVAHATSAVECVLGDITGDAMSLGKYLGRHSRLFHPALKKSLDGLYGYASDEGARHGRKEPNRIRKTLNSQSRCAPLRVRY